MSIQRKKLPNQLSGAKKVYIDLLIKFEECIEESNKKEIELYNKQLEIEKCINSLEPTERIIARSRYIEGKTFEQISVDLNYSWRHTIRIHGKILQKI